MKPIEFLEQAVTQTPTTPATPAQQAQLQAAQQQQAMGQARAVKATQQLNTKQLQQLLPNIDPAKLTTAIKAEAQGKRTNASLQALGIAFADLYKSDPATTTKVMNLLKKAQQLPPAQTQPAQSAISEGILDTVQAISKAPFQAVQKAKDIYHGAQAIGSGVKGAVQGIKQGPRAALQGTQAGYQASKIQQLNQEISNNLTKMIKNSITPTISKYAAAFANQTTDTKQNTDPMANKNAAIQAASKDIYNRVLKVLKIYNPNTEMQLANKIHKEYNNPTTEATAKNLIELFNNQKLFNSINQSVTERNYADLEKTLLSLVSSINTLRSLPGGKQDINSYLNDVESTNQPTNQPANEPNIAITIGDKVFKKDDPNFSKALAKLIALQKGQQQ